MKKEELREAAVRFRTALTKYRYAVAVLLAGALLLCVGGRGHDTPKAAEQDTQVFVLADFERSVEARLARIDGVGQLELMLTLEASEEAVYASNTRESAGGGQGGSREQSITVVSDSGYGQRPVTVKEIFPTFRGAVVLCEGADNIHVRCAVVEAVSTLCGIGSDKVAVLKMQPGE